MGNDMNDLVKKVEARIATLEGELTICLQKLMDMESKQAAKQPAEKEAVDGQETLEDNEPVRNQEEEDPVLETQSNDGSRNLNDDEIPEPEQLDGESGV